MGIISLNDKRLSGATSYKRTGKEISYHTANKFLELPSFEGVLDNLYVWYDYGNLDSWTGGRSSNEVDYTINNLAADHNHALIRRQVGNNNWETSSDSTRISRQSVNGGNMLLYRNGLTNTTTYPEIAVILPGSETSSSGSSSLYNIPTVSATSSNNLFNGVGTGAYTMEMWFQVYADISENSYTRGFFIRGHDSNVNDYCYNQILYWQKGQSSLSNKIRFQHYRSGSNSQDYLTHHGSTPTSDQWMGWTHIVMSREDDSSNGLKCYMNNVLQTNLTDDSDWDYLEYGLLPDNVRGYGEQQRFAVFRFYKGKALTSSEVATNWNLEKSRFGY